MAQDPQTEAEAFLKIADQFRLGELPTEQSHPDTWNLSEIAQHDLKRGFLLFQALDVAALRVVESQVGRIRELARAIEAVFLSGGRVFLCGCGATGRLALTVEALCREGMVEESFHDAVIGFMAGGDAALIRSLEGFEDREDFGCRQLEELGFRDGDLMVGITEGGETPFVIAATVRAAELSSVAPWFCYCNSDDVLCDVADRSKSILLDDRVERLPLITGPMALAGSTRLQATTVQLTAMCLALAHHDQPGFIELAAGELTYFVESLDYTAMAPFTETEQAIYAEGGNVIYETADYGLTVLTDTTERAPTFSLHPFENIQSPEHPASLSYLSLPNSAAPGDAWRAMLGRAPRTLEWRGVKDRAGLHYLMGYDISVHVRQHRALKTGQEAEAFRVFSEDQGFTLQLGKHRQHFGVSEAPWVENVMLKVLLNAHSTLLMGRLERYEGNLMTWVRPSNNKLIDRAIRYIRQLAERRGMTVPSYEVTCHALFRVRAIMAPDASVVLKTLEALEGA